MRRPPPLPEGSLETLKAAMKTARTKGEFQRVLCLWLRARLGMNADQVAVALCWSTPAVRRVWADYLHEGEDSFRTKGRGGRRHANLLVSEEQALLDGLAQRAQPNELVPVSDVQKAYEEAVGRPVAVTTVYRMLRRHRWHRVATGTAMVPLGWARIKVWEKRE